jgi:uncharacterized protein
MLRSIFLLEMAGLRLRYAAGGTCPRHTERRLTEWSSARTWDHAEERRSCGSRHAERAVYDLEQIHSMLDHGYIRHLGFVVDGQPFVIPTAYGRSGNQIYVHGSAASRTLCSLAAGTNVCATVTLVDGFVLARSALRHCINYRSVIILGKARLVTDPKDKMEGLHCLTNHLVPGRWEEVRPANETEVIKTSLLSRPLNEVSAKVRSGPPLGRRLPRSVFGQGLCRSGLKWKNL